MRYLLSVVGRGKTLTKFYQVNIYYTDYILYIFMSRRAILVLVENNVLRFNIHVTRKSDAHVHIYM